MARRRQTTAKLSHTNMDLSAVFFSAIFLLYSAEAQSVDSSPYCAQCLHVPWLKAVSTLQVGTDRCTASTEADIQNCLASCDATPLDMPRSFRIRQLTQISDILFTRRENGCLQGGDVECAAMADCLLSVSNYVNYLEENSTAYSPYPTVFNYKCGLEARTEASICLQQTSCLNSDLTQKLTSIMLDGLSNACDEPRRCVLYGNIFEVKPGSDCEQYYQEAASYGPSVDRVIDASPGLGFDPANCRPEFLNTFTCPDDPPTTQIYTERPPTASTTGPPPVYEDIEVNRNLPCEECLQPIWERAVTTNGSHLCQKQFRDLVITCLANCPCRPGSAQSACPADRADQLKIEVLIKLADINKALELNGCQGYEDCTKEGYNCTASLANFEPSSAPHVTVNDVNCGGEQLAQTLSCLDNECTGVSSRLMADVVQDAFPHICLSPHRCMTYGNIYEYVSVYDVNSTHPEVVTPCAYYRQAPAVGWHQSAISRVQPSLLFDMQTCAPQWPRDVTCPQDLTLQ